MPFSRFGAENSEIEGSGIGLSVTKQFLELMGGDIGFESEFGEGSVFWIDLPAGTRDEGTVDDVKVTESPEVVNTIKAVLETAPGMQESKGLAVSTY